MRIASVILASCSLVLSACGRDRAQTELQFPSVAQACNGPLMPVAAQSSRVEPGAIDPARFAASVRAWSDVKVASGATYTYEVPTSSWTGTRSTTTIEVVGDRVVRRSFEQQLISGDAAPVTTSWTEGSEQLGSHAQGAPAVTLDQLYQRCADEVVPKSANDNWIYFATYANGVLAHCSYAPKNCADDCSVGFEVAGLAVCAAAPASTACVAIEGAAFQSVDALECGLTPSGVATCPWQIMFERGTFQWSYSDVAETGSYSCAGAEITGNNGPSRQLHGSWDAQSQILTWDQIAYRRR